MGQDRTAVVGAFGVPSVACEKAGPVLALSGGVPLSAFGDEANCVSELKRQLCEYRP